MWLNSIIQWHNEGIACAMITIIDSSGSTPQKTGTHMVMNQYGDTAGSVGGGLVEFQCMDLARDVLNTGNCITRRFVSKGDGDTWEQSDGDLNLGLCGGTLTVFIEPIIPEPELVLFGGGHVGLALGKLCDVLDISYRVYDDRMEYADPDRFPGAKELICQSFTDISKHITLSERSYCVIMTYGHEHDEEVLDQLLKMKELPYIGMVGSVRKAGILIKNIQNRGGIIDDRLYCPVGLRIGKNLPQDIALSIISEVSLVMKGGTSEHMRVDWTNFP